jgi:hypothetical protein
MAIGVAQDAPHHEAVGVADIARPVVAHGLGAAGRGVEFVQNGALDHMHRQIIGHLVGLIGLGMVHPHGMAAAIGPVPVLGFLVEGVIGDFAGMVDGEGRLHRVHEPFVLIIADDHHHVGFGGGGGTPKAVQGGLAAIEVFGADGQAVLLVEIFVFTDLV